MVRADLDRNLKLLQEELLLLGGLVEKAIVDSIEALKTRNLELSHKVVAQDDIIDKKTNEIEEKASDKNNHHNDEKNSPLSKGEGIDKTFYEGVTLKASKNKAQGCGPNKYNKDHAG